MDTTKLTEEESRVLLRLIKARIRDHELNARDTKSHDFRDRENAKAETLNAILDKLGLADYR